MGEKTSFLETWRWFSRLDRETLLVEGREPFGDCIAGVPLMYSDRNQIGRQTPASLLFPFYSSGSGGFFLALSDHSEQS